MDRWVVFLHVAIAFWFVGGLIGRTLTLARARSSEDIDAVSLLTELAGRFENLMVIPGSIAVLLQGSWRRGRRASRSGDQAAVGLRWR